jgi:tellurite resistance protein
MKIAPDGSVVVFQGGHGKYFKPSGEFCMMGTILRLGSLVAQADQDLFPVEEEVLQRLIDDDNKLNAVEKQSLSAFSYWSLRTPQTAAGLKKNLAELSEAGKSTIGRILIAVANADGRIDRREVGQLEKLYLALGLDRDQVARDIHAVAAGSEPVTVGLREPAPAYTIPSPETAPGQGFVLNIELLRKIEKETEDVIDLLAPIFISKDEVEAVVEPAAEQDEVDPLAALDAPYRELLKRLLADSSWERSSLEAVCREFGLMPDGALEVLNEWAFENAEAPLIDYGEPIYINIELARGIMNA